MTAALHPVTDSAPVPLPEPVEPAVTPLTMKPRPVSVTRSPIAGVMPETPVYRTDDHAHPGEVPPSGSPAGAAEPAPSVATDAPAPAPEVESEEEAEARVRAERATAAVAARGDAERYRPVITRLIAWGAVLFRLGPGIKDPTPGIAWSKARGLTVEEAMDCLDNGENLGLDLLRSGFIVLDAENLSATQAVMASGYLPTWRTAKSLVEGHAKWGGTHTVVRIPEGVDRTQLSSDKSMQVKLPGGGLIDVLAGKRYAVIPPSWLEEVQAQYTPTAGGGLDLTIEGVVAEAPQWLFDLTAPCPPELAPLHGSLIPSVRERVEQNAESLDLSNRIDEISWTEWIAGDDRMIETSEVDGCGCPIWHWRDASHDKSMTLHAGCDRGYGIHIWSGTLVALMGCGQAHFSRLDFAAWLRASLSGEELETERSALMDSFGLKAEWERYEFTRDPMFSSEGIAAQADELAAAGEPAEMVDAWRRAAVVVAETDALIPARLAFLRARSHRDAAGETFLSEPMCGRSEASPAGSPESEPVPDNVIPLRSATETTETGPAVVQLDGLPPVHPDMELYRSHATAEVSRAAVPINTNNFLAKYLIPVDARSLREAVDGPRACQEPVDVEATHGQMADAVAAAVGGTKLRHTVDLEDWYMWNGVAWELNKSAPRVAVKGLFNRRTQTSDPVQRQRKLRAYTWKKVTQQQAARLVKFEGYKIDLETGTLFDPNGGVVESIAVSADAGAEGTPTQNAVIAQMTACAEVSCRVTDFDVDPTVLGTPGGYVVLGKDGITTMPPDPRLLVSKVTAAAYDPAATAPMWESAMENALPDPEIRGFLQRMAGQALFERQEHHILCVLRGPGGNSKGVFCDVMEGILGTYAAKVPSSVFTLAGANNHATDKMPMRGARMVFVNEVPPAQLNTEELKENTGGGTITARGIAKDSVTWPAGHTLFMTTNNGLQWPPSAVVAMDRRLHEIRFEVKFGAPGGPPRINGLADKIIAEEAAGVLNWCLAGYLDYIAHGRELDPPAKVREWSRETLNESSSWSAFCAGVFEVGGDTDEIYCKDIFKLWEHFKKGDTDQRHATPGSVRIVGGKVVEQIPSAVALKNNEGGRGPARVRGIKWSEDGNRLWQEMEAAVFAPGQGPNAWSMQPKFASVDGGPGMVPTVPPVYPVPPLAT